MISDFDRPKAELLAELAALREHVRQLEAAQHQSSPLRSPPPEPHVSLREMAFAAARVGIFETNLTTNTYIWSPELEALYGMESGTFGGRLADWEECVLPEDLPEVHAEMQRAAETGEPLSTVYRIRRRDTGEVRWIEARARLASHAEGAEVQFVGVNIDVTERVKAEQVIRESVERLGIAQRTGHSGLWDWNMSTQTLTWTPEFLELFGLAPGTEPSFDIWLNVLHPDDRESAMSRITSSIEKHTSVENEYRIVLPDGQIRWIMASGEVFYSDAGQPERMCGICVDITSRKAIEIELERSQRLYAAISQINQAVVRLNTRDELFQEVCRVLVEFGSFPLAWVALVDPSTHQIECVARQGNPDAAERALHLLFDHAGNIRTTVLEEEHAFVSNDILRTFGSGSLDGTRAASLGKSLAVCPIREGGALAGLFCIHSQEIDFFGKPEMALLLEASLDISFALDNMEREAQRQRSLDALRDSEARLRAFHSTSLDGFLVFQAVRENGRIVDFEFTFANPAAERMMNHSPLVGRRLLEVMPGHAGPGGLFERYVHVIETGESHDIEFPYEGEGVHGWFRNMSVKLGDGVAMTFSDISARKVAEEGRRESQAKLKAALGSMTDAVFISDTQGRFIDFNDAFATFHRFPSRDECLKSFAEYPDILDLYFADGTLAPVEMWPVRRALRGESAVDVEYTLHRKDSGEKWVASYSFAPIRGEDGTILGSVAVGRDITERKRAEAEVENLSVQRQLALDVAQLGWWHYNPITRISTWDDRYKEIFGVSDYSKPNEEILGRLHPEDLPNVLRKVEEALDPVDPKPFSAEYRINLPDGTVRWIDAHGIASFDGVGENRRATRLIGTVADVTERKQNDEKLLHAQQLMHHIISHARSAIAVHDRELNYLYVSDRYLDDYNLRDKDVIGKHHYEIFPDLPQKWRDVHQRALAGEVSSQEEDDFPRADGSIEWTRWECRPWYEADGSVGGMIIYTEMITERKRAENKLRQSLEDLNKAQAFANIGSWTWHVHGDRVEVSAQMYRIYEIDASVAEDRFTEAILARVHPDDRPHLEERHRRIRQLMAPGPMEFRIVLPDGRIRVLWSEIGETTRDEEGTPTQVKGIVQDITELKRAAEERQSLQLQLMQAQKMDSVGRLAGGVAHDFNNMLGVIMGCAELALRDLEPGSPIRLELDEIRTAAQRSADLTRQLLAFARKQTLMPQVLDLNDAVAGMIKMLRRLIGEDIDLSWHPGLELWPVFLDPGQVDQILVNLLVNARDAIETAGSVIIETENVSLDSFYCASHGDFTPGDYVMLAVSDNGHGINEETRQHIFEPFYTTKAIGEGTGLGLATVYGSVVQANGHINVYSEPEHGTTFRVYFPRHHAEAGNDKSQVSLPRPQGHGETVLLVEDEAALLKITKTMLQMLGYRVLPANSPQKALDLAREHEGDLHLIITDVVMPNINGRQLAEQLLAQHPTMKLLYMSGYTANVIAQHGILDEGVNFIQKPISLDDLAIKVRAVLDAP